MCLSKAFASKPQNVTFKLSTADDSRDIPPICGHAFQPLIRHCPKQPNLEGAHRLSFCARTPCDAAPSLQNNDAIRIELKGRAPTNTMASSCNNQYDKITYVGRPRNHWTEEVCAAVLGLPNLLHSLQSQRQRRSRKIARILTFNYRLKKGLGILRHRKVETTGFNDRLIQPVETAGWNNRLKQQVSTTDWKNRLKH